MSFISDIGYLMRKPIPDTVEEMQSEFNTRAASDWVSNVTPPARETRDIASNTMTLPSVYRSVSIISTTAQQMNFQTFRGKDQIPNAPIVRQPNLDIPVHAFVEQTVTSLALHGNAFWLVTRNQAGNPVKIDVLHPDHVGVVQEETNGRIYYTYNDKKYTNQDMKHLQLLRVPGELRGMGPIQQARYQVEATLQLRDYQSAFFDTSGVPTGVLKSDQFLNSETAAEYKAAWETAMAGLNRTAVLGSGLSYQPMYLNPKDAMFIEVANFGTEEIARMFGLPSRYLILPLQGSSTTYLNASQEDTWFMKFTMTNYLIEIETALSSLVPRGQEVKFNVEKVLRADTETRFNAYASALTTGWMTADEIRELENLPKMTAAQKHDVLLNKPNIGGIAGMGESPGPKNGKAEGVKGT